ncbi:hypothetical protein CAEBREN_25186 [Caenorhabditis brenneri]|uniref:Uncharacterized protein n=1 Tax=Caenorhabditis brenneri TaxID=135651 RepID=G0MQH7_CAEBE|nr:hypothetical protein CAEBREN_25186 [Caenorhabditis brenneri]
MRLLLVLLLLFVEFHSTSAAYRDEPFHHMDIKFDVENGKHSNTTEVFLQFWGNTIVKNEELAIQLVVTASKPFHFAADKCGRRLFENQRKISNETYLLNSDFYNTSRTDIAKHCEFFREHAINFTVYCDSPCSGSMNFSFTKKSFRDMSGNGERFNDMEGAMPFVTKGDGVLDFETSDVGYIIDAVFLNARLRFSLSIEYSTEYTLVIGKCGLEMLKLRGNQTRLNYELNWEETKQLRLAKTLQCPEFMNDLIYYSMDSKEAGEGTVTFLMTKSLKEMDGHPQKTHGFMELAIGVPDPNYKEPEYDINSADFTAIIPIFFIIGLIFVL